MYRLLGGLRIVEGSSFIAAPSCGLYCAQMGAEVIRFDQIGGGPDYGRWPLDPASGASFYWEGLNKGKKSIALDLRRPEGRELAVRLATAAGDGAGLFLTNFPADGFLSHARLSELRADLVTVRVMGNADGTSALDYTANAAVGIPFMTGRSDGGDAPVNNVLPTWDLLTGAYAAFTLLAVERERRATGRGREVRLPLSDIAAATIGNLGQIAEAGVGGDRARLGNDVFGAFGRDFRTADGRYVMLLAITPKQWRGLLHALGIADAVSGIEAALGTSFATDEGERFRHRETLFALVERAVATRPSGELASAFDEAGVCWGPYRTVSEAVADPLVAANPVFSAIDHPSGRRYPTPGAMATLAAEARAEPARAPRLGEHSEEVLATVLSLSGGEIARLHDAGIVAGAAQA